MSTRHTLALAAAISTAALAAACGNSHPASPKGTGGSGGQGGGAGTDAGEAGTDAGTAKCGPVDAANAVPASSPLAQGEYDLLCNTWGLEVLDEWPPASFMLDLMKNEPSVFGNQYTKFGFIPDPNDEFPIGFKRGTADPDKVHGTCGLCHVARLPDGKLWLGAPNERLELGRFQIEVNKRWVAAGNPPLLDSQGLADAAQLGPGRIGAGGDGALIPDDIPVAYNLADRKFLSKLGTGHDIKSEVYLSLFGFGAGYPDDQHAKVPFPSDSELAQFISAFGSYDPPPAPAQDPTLVSKGEQVFATARCNSCHKVGNLGAEGYVTVDSNGQERFPGDDPAFPRGSIMTDPLMVTLVTGNSGSGGDAGASDAGAGDAGDGGLGFDPSLKAFVAFIVKHNLSVGTSDGYRVPDLRGVWASAPYLHNGSVPTLDDLLKPASARPAKWNPLPSVSRDSSIIGEGNYGHEFGTTLSASDKTALVAYLNSL